MKKQVATMLRGLATMLDPPAAQPEKRAHPALSPPPELKLEQRDEINATPPGASMHRVHPDDAPGRWGGPYL